jgi:hypothetical protein
MFRRIKAFFYALRVATMNFILKQRGGAARWIRLRFVPGWFPRFRIYKLFDEWIVEAKPITVHYWTAIAFHGGGTVVSPKPMNEAQALAWVATFGNVAYVDRETGFIFYRKE